MAAGVRAARRRRPGLDPVGIPAPPKGGPRGAETGPGGELLPQPPARGAVRQFCASRAGLGSRRGRRKELKSSPAGGFGAGKASPAGAGAALPQRLLLRTPSGPALPSLALRKRLGAAAPGRTSGSASRARGTRSFLPSRCREGLPGAGRGFNHAPSRFLLQTECEYAAVGH